MRTPLCWIVTAILVLTGPLFAAREELVPQDAQETGSSIEEMTVVIGKKVKELNDLIDGDRMRTELTGLIECDDDEKKNLGDAIKAFRSRWIGEGSRVAAKPGTREETEEAKWFETVLALATKGLDDARAARVTGWFTTRKDEVTRTFSEIGKLGAAIGAEGARIATDTEALAQASIAALRKNLTSSLGEIATRRTVLEKICREIEPSFHENIRIGEFEKARLAIGELSRLAESEKWKKQADAIRLLALNSLEWARPEVLDTLKNRQALEKYAEEITHAAEELRKTIDLKYDVKARTRRACRDSYENAIEAYRKAAALSRLNLKEKEKQDSPAEADTRIRRLQKTERSLLDRDEEIRRLRTEIEALREEVRRIREERSRRGEAGKKSSI